jgi:hypothetical protein
VGICDTLAVCVQLSLAGIPAEIAFYYSFFMYNLLRVYFKCLKNQHFQGLNFHCHQVKRETPTALLDLIHRDWE